MEIEVTKAEFFKLYPEVRTITVTSYGTIIAEDVELETRDEIGFTADNLVILSNGFTRPYEAFPETYDPQTTPPELVAAMEAFDKESEESAYFVLTKELLNDILSLEESNDVQFEDFLNDEAILFVQAPENYQYREEDEVYP